MQTNRNINYFFKYEEGVRENFRGGGKGRVLRKRGNLSGNLRAKEI